MDKKKVIAIVVAVIVLALIIVGIVMSQSNREYTVTFDSNGGTEVASQTVKNNETASEPKSPTKEGFVFAGWYNSKNVKFSFKTKITENTTLTAKWNAVEENTLTALSVVSSKSEIRANEEMTLTLKTTPENASLEGVNVVWTSSDESVAKVDANGKVKALKEGKAIITVKAGDITATYTVDVKKTESEATPTATATAKPTSKATTKPTATTTTAPTSAPTAAPTSAPTAAPTSAPTAAPTSAPTTAPTATATPTPKPTPSVTYSYKEDWVEVKGSIAGQYTLYIQKVGSDGSKEYVAGNATVTLTNGKTQNYSVSKSGIVLVKSSVKSVSVSAN